MQSTTDPSSGKVTIRDVLSRLDRVSGGNGQWLARCPAHEDNRDSLSISIGDGGRILLHDHAGCSFNEVCEALGYSAAQLMPERTNGHVGTNGNAAAAKAKKKTTYVTMEAAGKVYTKKFGKPHRYWVYHHANGEEVGAVLRWDTCNGKEIRPLALIGGGWCCCAIPTPRPLYQLPRIAPHEGIIFVVEGEKCADAIESIGMLATTCAGGAAAADKTDWSPLAGKNVVVWPDNDEPGEKYCSAVCVALSALTPPAIVRIIRPDGLPDGGDAYDWIKQRAATDADDRRAQIMALADAAPVFVANAVNESIDDMNESIDDPHRLATSLLSESYTHPDGTRTLVYHRDEFHQYNGVYYHPVPTLEIRAHITAHARAEFVAENEHLAANRELGTEREMPTCKKVTCSLVSNALAALQSMTLLSHRTAPPAWLGEAKPFAPADEILATRSGLLHLPSLIAGREYLHPSTPRFFSAQCLTYRFDPNAPEPANWLAFLAQLWRDDLQSISTLQEWFGYCLLNDTRLQKMLLLIGPRRSGKGTIARVLRAMIGEDNVAGPTLAGLGTNFGLWPLLGKQLAIISDARLSNRTDSAIVTERLLSITGEDALTIDRKCLQPVTVKLPTRLMMLTNELPRLGDSSGALAGRMIALVLRESFFGREDHDLTSKLLGELPGILLWAIAGWERLRSLGRFVQPEAGRELSDEMEDLASPIGKFVRERCLIDPQASIRRDDLYTAWKGWCESQGKQGNHITDAATFGRDIRAAVPGIGGGRRREDGERCYHYDGITLRRGLLS